MHKTNKFKDPLLLVATIAKYALGCSYASRMLHLEVEEVFKSYKEGSNLPPSQRGICTNMTMLIFLILEMDTTTINITTKTHYGDPLTTIRSHCGIPIIMHNGCEVCGKYFWTWCVVY